MSAPTDQYQGLGMYCVQETEVTHWEWLYTYQSGQYFDFVQRIIKLNDTLYVTKSANNTDSRLVAVDATYPSLLVVSEEIGVGDNPRGLCLIGSSVFVTNFTGPNVQKFNIFDPDHIVADGVSATTSLAGIVDVVFYGNFLYCACDVGVVRMHKDTLAIVNASTALSSGSIKWGGISQDGTIYYGVTAAGTVVYFDITDIGVAPVYIGETITIGAQSLKVREDLLYIHSHGAFYIYDITTPSSPVYKSHESNSNLGGSGGLDIAGNYAFVCANSSNCIVILSIRNSSDPVVTQIISSFDVIGLSGPTDIVMKKDYGFITSSFGDGIVVIGPPVTIEPVTTGLYDSLVSTSPYGIWHLHNAYTINDAVPDDGMVPNYMILSGATPPTKRLGPNNGIYPELSNGTRVGPFVNAFFKTEIEDYPGMYTSGMTMLVVVYPAQDAGGGDFMTKMKPASTNAAENLFTFAPMKIAAATRRGAGAGSSSMVINQNSSTPINKWHIIEAYYPPGWTMPILHKDGDLVTDVVTNNFGFRDDFGVGSIHISGRGFFNPGLHGWYAIGGIWNRQLTSTERVAYKAAAVAEGWIP